MVRFYIDMIKSAVKVSFLLAQTETCRLIEADTDRLQDVFSTYTHALYQACILSIYFLY
jgi:hypothetical protein